MRRAKLGGRSKPSPMPSYSFTDHQTTYSLLTASFRYEKDSIHLGATTDLSERSSGHRLILGSSSGSYNAGILVVCLGTEYRSDT
jgi:hypothetical protein